MQIFGTTRRRYWFKKFDTEQAAKSFAAKRRWSILASRVWDGKRVWVVSVRDERSGKPAVSNA